MESNAVPTKWSGVSFEPIIVGLVVSSSLFSEDSKYLIPPGGCRCGTPPSKRQLSGRTSKGEVPGANFYSRRKAGPPGT